jgi:glycosyltransferase involved in cell wall biosynthesis
MRIAFLTSGRSVPSSRFRVLAYVPHLEQRGHECLILPSRPEKYGSLPLLGFRLSGLVKRWFRWRDLAVLERWSPDVVVLERELFSDATCDVEQHLRRIARRIVLDIDDGLFVLHRHKFEVLCGLSDHIIAGNDLLAERVRPVNPRVTVIPTCVDVERYRMISDFGSRISDLKKGGPDAAIQSAIRNPKSAITLGWTGTAANIAYLDVLREPLKQLAREFPIELRVIAESHRPLKQLGFERDGIPIRFTPWSEATEMKDLATFDLGLMPMPDTDWTRFKCGLKILQYMAVGVPAIASPVGVNRQVIQHGINGWLASTPDEWLGVLRFLLSDAGRRAVVLPAARRLVEEQYSIQVHCPRMVTCLEAVCAGQ